MLLTAIVAATSASVAPAATPVRDRQLSRLVFALLRPYRVWLAIVFIAMLVEIATSLAAPWPLKLVLDDPLGKHHLTGWLGLMTTVLDVILLELHCSRAPPRWYCDHRCDCGVGSVRANHCEA